jgi:TP53 regulating kinase and related kinases
VTDEQMIYQGAEAKIIRSTYHGFSVVKKKRMHKRYRIKEIDTVLIKSRTRDEAKIMALARTIGVSVPIIYDVDMKSGCITFEYIKGDRVKNIFDSLTMEKRKNLCYLIGSQIALLHNAEIVHGDLTTSNMLVSDQKVYFIDFGLSELTADVEARGVDLHLLMEALESTHSSYKTSFSDVFKGYSDIYKSDAKKVKEKIDDIVKRGRYR